MPTRSSASSTPGHVGLARERVVADRQQLALAAEEHLLVRDEPRQADGVHAASPPSASAVALAVPDGASFLASPCSSTISARGR